MSDVCAYATDDEITDEIIAELYSRLNSEFDQRIRKMLDKKSMYRKYKIIFDAEKRIHNVEHIAYDLNLLKCFIRENTLDEKVTEYIERQENKKIINSIKDEKNLLTTHFENINDLYTFLYDNKKIKMMVMHSVIYTELQKQELIQCKGGMIRLENSNIIVKVSDEMEIDEIYAFEKYAIVGESLQPYTFVKEINGKDTVCIFFNYNLEIDGRKMQRYKLVGKGIM